MKSVKFLGAFAIVASLAFTSCKKDYTCTCTTSVGSISNTKTYDLKNQNRVDANDACERYETDANNGGIGTTSCHL